MSLPERLLDLASAAHACRVAGHSEQEIARAAGFPERFIGAQSTDALHKAAGHVLPSAAAEDPARR
jgi:hypothetical protein